MNGVHTEKIDLIEISKTIILQDFKKISREMVLLLILLAPFFMLIAFSLVFSFFIEEINFLLGFDLGRYKPVFNSMLIAIPSLMLGFVLGFTFLDEKDDGTALTWFISPIAISKIITIRFLPWLFLSFLMQLISAIVFQINMNLALLLAIMVLSSLQVVVFTFILSGIAKNKVQGLVVAKLLSLPLFLPVIAILFFPLSRYYFSFIPGFWTFSLFLRQDLAADPGLINSEWEIILGMAVQLFYCLLSYNFYKRNTKS